MEKRPLIGVGVIIIKDKKVLLGQRLNAHGEGTWCFPGGHLEYGEQLEVCAKRETEEEAGITITNVRLGTLTNDIFPKEEKHYITIYMVADYESGEVQVKEPHKLIKWQWFEWDKFPSPLFLPLTHLMAQKFSPFDHEAT